MRRTDADDAANAAQVGDLPGGDANEQGVPCVAEPDRDLAAELAKLAYAVLIACRRCRRRAPRARSGRDHQTLHVRRQPACPRAGRSLR